jgi:hypothetical protein
MKKGCKHEQIVGMVLLAWRELREIRTINVESPYILPQ